MAMARGANSACVLRGIAALPKRWRTINAPEHSARIQRTELACVGNVIERMMPTVPLVEGDEVARSNFLK